MPITDLYDKIVSEKGGFEKLIAKIPGFRGYQEMQARRTADTLLRRYLGDRMEQVVKRFTRLENDILDGGKGLKYMTRTREVKSKLQAYTDIINTANPKYSGMWDSVKIDADALERIYSFDEAQVRYIDDLEGKIGALEDALKGGDFGQELESLYEVAVEAIDAFGLRDREILGLDAEIGSTHQDERLPRKAFVPPASPVREARASTEDKPTVIPPNADAPEIVPYATPWQDRYVPEETTPATPEKKAPQENTSTPDDPEYLDDPRHR